MEYLLKVSVLIAVFYSVYKLLLERDTFFEVNRGFLLFGLIISFLLPICIIHVYHEYTPEPINNLTEVVTVTTEASEIVEESFAFEVLDIFQALQTK